MTQQDTAVSSDRNGAGQAFLTLDFEASCLPRHGRSFPIEVGIANLYGQSRYWLVRPDREWQNWMWTVEAEALHGLTRQQLENEGQSATAVMRQLNSATRGYRVISDSVLDQAWLATLSQTAGIPAEFKIEHISELLNFYDPAAASIRRAVERANDAAPVRHRARADALWLACIVDSLIQGSHNQPA